MIQKKAVVPPALQTAKTSAELFGFIADHLQNFLEEYHPDHCDKYQDPKEDWYRLGFTFSFPVIQTKINAGKLMRWTKGFNIQVFQEADFELRIRKLSVKMSSKSFNLK